MPMMCEECKCSNWYCAECGESNHHDCGCSCCGCKCQTQPTNQIGEPTMTMINPTPTEVPNPVEESMLYEELERVIADRARVQESKDSYVEKFHRSQSTLNSIITAINADINELGLTTDDSFPLDTLASIFEDHGLTLNFDRLFKVEMEYTIRAVIEVEAASEEDAVSDVQANVSLYDVSIDGGTVVDWHVYNESFLSAEEA